MNIPFKQRLLLSYFGITVIFSLITGASVYLISQRVLNNLAVKNINLIMDQISEDINSLFSEALNLTKVISNDSTINNVLKRQFDSIEEQFSWDLKISQELLFISRYRHEIFGTYVLGENGGKYKSNDLMIRLNDLTETEWYQATISSSNAIWFPPHIESFALTTSGNSLITLGIPIIDKSSMEKLGVVMTEIDERDLFDIIHQRLGNQGVISIHFDNYHTTESRVFPNITIYPNDRDKSKTEEQDLPSRENKSRYRIIKRELLVPNWYLTAEIDLQKISGWNNLMNFAVILVVFLSLFISFIFASRVSKGISDPINSLVETMKKTEQGNLSFRIDNHQNNEFGILSRTYNNLLDHIQLLMSKVENDQVLIKQAELKALQAQINPHFLYNTFDSISWLIRKDKKESALNLMTALTRMFRLGLNNGKDIISLKEEINHVKNYLIIQKIRYNNKFDYFIDVDESLSDCRVIKLILQPLVENAIYHGIKEKREKGTISIHVREESGFLLLSVEDSGPGIDSSTLKNIYDTFNGVNIEEYDSYGLKNINDRIKLFAGEIFGLTFENKSPEGCRAIIKFPVIKG
ncbi:MAG: hypothetical protein B6241_06750 [Spirochaetaceae bacterium 4572_59]|nr:MAG: hypothetical protein B6241_06750 [Spirochaetaceae bacterium 4572_59]